MSTRTALTVVGGLVGAYFGYPQLGLVIGGLIGGAVDPQQIQGPKIGEVNVQTSQEGAPRTIVYGAIACYGNIIQTGQVVKVETTESQGKGGGPEVTTETALRTFAIRICEGPIAAVLRVWADNKLVYDMRTGSGMIPESQKWAANKVFYLGDESQTPDPTLVATVNTDTPSYRGSAYMVCISEDVTERRGSIAQYRFEVAKEVSASIGESHQGPTEALGTYLDAGSDGNPYMIGNQTNGGGQLFEVGSPGSYDVLTYSSEDFTTSSIEISGTTFANVGDTPGDARLWPIAADNEGYALSYDGNFGYCKLTFNGSSHALYRPQLAGSGAWWFNEAGFYPEYGGLVWFYENFIFLGVRKTGNTGGTSWNRIMKFPKQAATGTQLPLADALNISSNSAAPVFWMHVSRNGTVRAIDSMDYSTIQQYDDDLTPLSSLTVPADIQAEITGGAVFRALGIDEQKGLQAYAYWITTPSAALHVDIYDLSGNLKHAASFPTAENQICTRLIFTNSNLFIQNRTKTFVISVPDTYESVSPLLSEIVSDIHDRCGFNSDGYDVSELTDVVSGLGLAGDYTGASAIDTLRPVYFFDKSEHDKKLWYPKRGAAVIETLTVDDLTEIPDTTKREQAIEVPKKLHLRYQHAASGYAPVKATASSSSPDMLTTGEASLEIPVVLNEDQAAQAVDKMYKVTRSEVRGTTEISVPLDVGAKYVAGNCIGLSLRGRLTRERIDQQEFDGLSIKLILKPDRQSAYTSDLTGVPIPEPTLPPSTIVGETIMAILDIPARVDSEDDLNYLVAVTGRLPPWYGARYQRSLDAGASYATVQDITTASMIGELLADVPDAMEGVTDTTNSVLVSLYRPGQSLESISNTEFLSEGGAFALEKLDGSWEIMQYRDCVEQSDGSFVLTRLHRGLLNSGPSVHTTGARFVMLARPSHIPAQAAWIGQELTHRAISLGESADDTDNDETHEFVGRSQIEWPITSFVLSRSGSDISATWNPRHRFGTDDNPVQALRFNGYRVTIDDGVISDTFDTTSQGFTNYDASAFGSPVTVTVSALNTMTGAGPSTSEEI